jgi:acylphosphatase
MVVCKHVYYSGRVQGIGFRYTAQSLAAQYPVRGFVRNLPNGDVELVADGAEKDVDAFLAAVAQRLAGYIRKADVRDEEPGGHEGFHIRY